MRLVEILIGILVFIIGVAIGTLIFWGIGNLFIWIFNINYIWTIWHGLAVEIIYIILKGIFKR